MKKIIYNIHLWLSIPFGVIISIICLTGAILVFEKEIIQFKHPELYQADNQEELPLLPPSELMNHLKDTHDDSLKIASLTYSGASNGTCIVSFENDKRKLSVNPYTGEKIGWIEPDIFFQNIRKLHRWLLNAPENRQGMSAGKLIVGVSTLLMVIILISGIWLWIPRTRKGIKNRLTICTQKGWKRFWYDCHVSLGVYPTILLLLMALTGLTWSFDWYRNTVYGLFEADSRRGHHTATPQSDNSSNSQGTEYDYKIWDNVFTQMSIKCPSYSQIRIEKDKAQASPYKTFGFRDTHTIYFNRTDGEITKYQPAENVTLSQKLRTVIFSLHTGTWGGLIVKILYFLAGLIGATLPLTGYYLWIKKQIDRRTK